MRRVKARARRGSRCRPRRGSARRARGGELDDDAERLEHVGAADARPTPRGCRAWRPARPRAAATSAAAVETLNVPAPSPPVPQVSTTPGGAPGSATACARIARAAPTISSTVSPFMRSATRSAPICAGVASPSMIARIDRRHLVLGEVARRSASARRSALARRHAPHAGPAPPAAAGRGSCASSCLPSSVRIDSGWNCTPSTGRVAVAHAHDLALVGPRRDAPEHVGQRRRLDDQRVVARRLERVREAGEDARPSWRIGDVLPCMMRGARTIVAAEAPRRSPGGRGRRRGSGSRPAKRWMSATEMPASLGVHGPGRDDDRRRARARRSRRA